MHKFFSSRFAALKAEPELDLPKYHPHATPLPSFPNIERTQNADVQTVINYWVAMIVEMTMSDSAERASGFKAADIGRTEALLTKIQSLVDTIEADPEIDLPDASDVNPTAG